MFRISLIALGILACVPGAALAAPTLNETACPVVRTAEGAVDTGAQAKGLAAATSYVPAPLFGGELYCTVGIRPGASMFSAGTPVAKLHERGTIDDVAYRIDYHRSWVEVYLDDGAAAYAPSRVVDANKAQPHFLCRYALTVDGMGAPIGKFDDATHSAASEVTCAQLPRADRDIIFWFSPNTNGASISKLVMYDTVDGKTKYMASDALPKPDPLPERMDGQPCQTSDIMLAIPDVPGALCLKGAESVLGFNALYQDLFGPLGANGLDILGARDSRPLLISRSVGKFVGAMEGKDYFLVGALGSNRAEYRRVPTKRLFRSLPLMGPIAQRMAEAGK